MTKHEHACMVVEIADERVVIDPGNFTTPLIDVLGVVAIVITHEHPDHWTPEQLTRILDLNQGARIFAPASVVAQAEGFEIDAVHEGDVHEVGGFRLEFFGSQHAVIHPTIPVISNVGVMVNDSLFYPGDAFTVPPKPVDTLAAPANAPWMKVAEAMDYVTAVAPKRSFPAHEMLLSVLGKQMYYARLQSATEAAGGVFHPLEPGDTLEL
ncbi:L-ascorbate metabolism protein UlaG (beta-lactamase superfamily) [Diaminobutyricimonas aerilata]|uniref:L-ascorbate metabolism protein UlaG (Beta-lactamase superfamily) n=1 Tax=Diaminobutyricimonas aerilata TaxID=1162967 RepID=A0A2M9CHI2_9MICO|nr:L-ascorbate metabolism protein UlaG (beta-lactamase superfamily) [Diaminobutyricimonas aerilata]